MTNVEALKQIYTSLGGMLTDTYPTIANGIPVSDYSLISDVVAAISFKTGSGLPDVTAEDKGKVLTVDDDGEWTAAAPSGGIIFYEASFAGNTLKLPVSQKQIYEDFTLNGKEVIVTTGTAAVLRVAQFNKGTTVTLSGYYLTTDNTITVLYANCLSTSNDNTATMTRKTITVS